MSPDPKTSCGPYTPVSEVGNRFRWDVSRNISRWNHDTIGMVVIDKHGIISGGTSTNGMTHKIPGRVGDSPIPGLSPSILAHSLTHSLSIYLFISCSITPFIHPMHSYASYEQAGHERVANEINQCIDRSSSTNFEHRSRSLR